MNALRALAKPQPGFTPMPAPASVLQRKCACGNHTSAGSLCDECRKELTIQRKAIIGDRRDSYELEADRAAALAMAIPPHRFIGGAQLRVGRISGLPSGTQSNNAPSSVDDALASLGRPLEPTLQRDMNDRFGYDFSSIRVHTGPAAERSAMEVNSFAYTVGNEVVFGRGRFAPGTAEGRRLLAHELTHVVQQSGTTAYQSKRESCSLNPNVPPLAGLTVLQRDGDLSAVLRALEAGDWDVDSLAEQLTDQQMTTLSAEVRIRLIRNIADGYSVLDTDEQTILRLLRTAPSIQRAEIIFLLDSNLLDRLELVLDGEEYQQYHTLLQKIFFNARSVSQAVREVETTPVFPWADPGIIRGYWNVRFSYEVAEFTEQGKLRFVYWQGIAGMAIRNQSIEVDPMQMIQVRFFDDEAEVAAVRGQTMPMPAISLLALVQKQFRGEVQAAADIAMIAAGGAGLVSASTRVARAVAALELAFGAANAVVRDFRPAISRSPRGKDFLAVWDVVNAFVAIYGLGRLAIEGGRIFLRLRQAWRAFSVSDDAVRLGDNLDLLGQNVDEMLEQADAARATRSGAVSAGGEATVLAGLSDLARRARELVRQIRARGETVIANMGGAGARHEPSGAININNQAVGRIGIPNHVEADASTLGELFDASSIDQVVGYHMPYGVIDWQRAVPGIHRVLRTGGTFRFDWRGSTLEAAEVERLLQQFGFTEIQNFSNALIQALKP